MCPPGFSVFLSAMVSSRPAGQRPSSLPALFITTLLVLTLPTEDVSIARIVVGVILSVWLDALACAIIADWERECMVFDPPSESGSFDYLFEEDATRSFDCDSDSSATSTDCASVISISDEEVYAPAPRALKKPMPHPMRLSEWQRLHQPRVCAESTAPRPRPPKPSAPLPKTAPSYKPAAPVFRRLAAIPFPFPGRDPCLLPYRSYVETYDGPPRSVVLSEADETRSVCTAVPAVPSQVHQNRAEYLRAKILLRKSATLPSRARPAPIVPPPPQHFIQSDVPSVTLPSPPASPMSVDISPPTPARVRFDPIFWGIARIQAAGDAEKYAEVVRREEEARRRARPVASWEGMSRYGVGFGGLVEPPIEVPTPMPITPCRLPGDGKDMDVDM